MENVLGVRHRDVLAINYTPSAITTDNNDRRSPGNEQDDTIATVFHRRD